MELFNFMIVHWFLSLFTKQRPMGWIQRPRPPFHGFWRTQTKVMVLSLLRTDIFRKEKTVTPMSDVPVV